MKVLSMLDCRANPDITLVTKNILTFSKIPYPNIGHFVAI